MTASGIIDIFLNLDEHLDWFIMTYGAWAYVFLFLVIFFETGVVVTPFLPGDSLLFAAGILAGSGALDPVLLTILLIVAAIIGDSLNYWIGTFVGPRVVARKSSRFFKPEYLARTQAFYERHGGKTVVLARFVPIIRTFAPFAAGIARMRYPSFLFYNIAGAVAWVFLFVLGGYFFGKLPFVVDHFSFVVLIIIIVSLMPFALELAARSGRARRKKAGNSEPRA